MMTEAEMQPMAVAVPHRTNPFLVWYITDAVVINQLTCAVIQTQSVNDN